MLTMLKIQEVVASTSVEEPHKLICQFVGTFLSQALSAECEHDLKLSTGMLWRDTCFLAATTPITDWELVEALDELTELALQGKALGTPSEFRPVPEPLLYNEANMRYLCTCLRLFWHSGLSNHSNLDELRSDYPLGEDVDDAHEHRLYQDVLALRDDPRVQAAALRFELAQDAAPPQPTAPNQPPSSSQPVAPSQNEDEMEKLREHLLRAPSESEAPTRTLDIPPLAPLASPVPLAPQPAQTSNVEREVSQQSVVRIDSNAGATLWDEEKLKPSERIERAFDFLLRELEADNDFVARELGSAQSSVRPRESPESNVVDIDAGGTTCSKADTDVNREFGAAQSSERPRESLEPKLVSADVGAPAAGATDN